MNTINLNRYRERKQMQRLYQLYAKKDYTTTLHNQFCMELINWYDPEISIPFTEGLLAKYGAEAFTTDILQNTLEEAFSAFRYMYKLYI